MWLHLTRSLAQQTEQGARGLVTGSGTAGGTGYPFLTSRAAVLHVGFSPNEMILSSKVKVLSGYHARLLSS